MIKVLVFIRKLPEITMDDFITYYESRHAPMVNEILPMYSGYRRNYLAEGLYPPGVSSDFDVVTELLFDNEGDYSDWQEALSDPVIVDRIRADEANFLQSDATTMWVVRCCE